MPVYSHYLEHVEHSLLLSFTPTIERKVLMLTRTRTFRWTATNSAKPPSAYGEEACLNPIFGLQHSWRQTRSNLTNLTVLDFRQNRLGATPHVVRFACSLGRNRQRNQPIRAQVPQTLHYTYRHDINTAHTFPRLARSRRRKGSSNCFWE